MGPEFEVRADISCKRGSKGLRIIRIQRRAIGANAAIKHARKLLHTFWNALIADPQLSERMIHILEEFVGNLLRKCVQCRIFSLHAVKGEKNMQRKHFITAKRCIRHLKLCIKSFLPRRRHDHFINAKDDSLVCFRFAAE
ncbi:hypothetical protein DK68_3137 [Brucella suis]|nr:hypothetical protein DK68_3137 [Brucella suis]